VECWTQAAASTTDALELTWLYHEIGRALMIQESFKAALDAGLKSRELAEQEQDPEWQLNSNLLVAQAHGWTSLFFLFLFACFILVLI